MNYKIHIAILRSAVLIEAIIIIFLGFKLFRISSVDTEAAAQKNDAHFYYVFNVSETLEETSSMEKSPSPYWWVNSGGYLTIADGVGKTAAGMQPISSRWRSYYEKSNPTDTDNGLHPQNIFRIILKSKWKNFQEEAYFNIKEYNLSPSKNRNLSNGIFLLARYQDENNTYYLGLRVDGNAIVKKKVAGKYYTLAEKKVWDGRAYNKVENPIMLPKNTWIGIRAEIKNVSKDEVSLELSIDRSKTGVWNPVLQVIDDGKVGGPAIAQNGFAGIRTDFMDAEFSDYTNMEI